MPKMSQSHMFFAIQPYPGARFTLWADGSLHIECKIEDARANLNWMREFLDRNVEPEIAHLEAEFEEKNRKRPVFRRGEPVETGLPKPPAYIPQGFVAHKPAVTEKFVPQVPSTLPVTPPPPPSVKVDGMITESMVKVEVEQEEISEEEYAELQGQQRNQ